MREMLQILAILLLGFGLGHIAGSAGAPVPECPPEID